MALWNISFALNSCPSIYMMNGVLLLLKLISSYPTGVAAQLFSVLWRNRLWDRYRFVPLKACARVPKYRVLLCTRIFLVTYSRIVFKLQSFSLHSDKLDWCRSNDCLCDENTEYKIVLRKVTLQNWTQHSQFYEDLSQTMQTFMTCTASVPQHWLKQ